MILYGHVGEDATIFVGEQRRTAAGVGFDARGLLSFVFFACNYYILSVCAPYAVVLWPCLHDWLMSLICSGKSGSCWWLRNSTTNYLIRLPPTPSVFSHSESGTLSSNTSPTVMGSITRDRLLPTNSESSGDEIPWAVQAVHAA